jgi:hypothetical protein
MIDIGEPDYVFMTEGSFWTLDEWEWYCRNPIVSL